MSEEETSTNDAAGNVTNAVDGAAEETTGRKSDRFARAEIATPETYSQAASDAMTRLESALHERNIYPVADWDSGVLTYLHTRNASVSVEEDDPPPRQRYRVEHVNREGNPTRTILVAVARVEDVAWLVAVYVAAEQRTRIARGNAAEDEGAMDQGVLEQAERGHESDSEPKVLRTAKAAAEKKDEEDSPESSPTATSEAEGWS